MESRLIFLHLMDISHKGLRIAYKKSLIDYEYPQAVPETDTGR